jgi:hypothetical protein
MALIPLLPSWLLAWRLREMEGKDKISLPPGLKRDLAMSLMAGSYLPLLASTASTSLVMTTVKSSLMPLTLTMKPNLLPLT